jgi:hypothetical protein
LSLNKIFNAHWINPEGKAHGVTSSHIKNIIKNPSYFSLTKEKIDQTYSKYNEPMGLEGKARNEIMTDLLQNGWIRIRKNRNSYTAQLLTLDDKSKIYLQQFTSKMITDGVQKYSDLKILTSTKVEIISFEEVSSWHFKE